MPWKIAPTSTRMYKPDYEHRSNNPYRKKSVQYTYVHFLGKPFDHTIILSIAKMRYSKMNHLFTGFVFLQKLCQMSMYLSVFSGFVRRAPNAPAAGDWWTHGPMGLFPLAPTRRLPPPAHTRIFKKVSVIRRRKSRSPSFNQPSQSIQISTNFSSTIFFIIF